MKSSNQSTIMGIDRGSKYIGLAYVQKGQKVPFPIGYLLNDNMVYYSMADLVMRHSVQKIVVGFPTRQEDIQAKITEFIAKLKLVIHPDIEFELVDENYSSVQSGEIVSNFKKNVAEDTVSAMIILERWIEQGPIDD